jgi:DNA-directed RNA polymerase subunit M/transcription elongation factor TFIIS
VLFDYTLRCQTCQAFVIPTEADDKLTWDCQACGRDKLTILKKYWGRVMDKPLPSEVEAYRKSIEGEQSG